MAKDKAKRSLTFITNTITSFGGGEQWVFDVSTRLKKSYDITIASPLYKNVITRRSMAQISKRYDLSGIKIVDLESRGLNLVEFNSDNYTMALPKVRTLPKLSAMIKNTDVIYLLSFNPIFLSVIVALAKRHRKKLILGIHNPTFYKLFEGGMGARQSASVKLFTSVIRQIKYFHVLTDEDELLVRSKFPKAKVTQVPIFITIKQQKLKVNTKEFVAVQVGRLETSQKGIDLLQRIVDKTSSKNPHIKFHLMGSGGDGERIVEEMTKKHQNFKWLGYTLDGIKNREYLNASAYISTSRYETLPAVVLEGQSFGLPVIGFRVKGASQIVSKEFQGQLIDNFDVDKFVESIQRTYAMWAKDKRTFSTLRNKISKEVYSRYNEKTVMRKMEKMIDL